MTESVNEPTLDDPNPIHLICDSFKRDLRSGSGASIESVLEAWPTIDQTELFRELLASELEVRAQSRPCARNARPTQRKSVDNKFANRIPVDAPSPTAGNEPSTVT